MNADIRIGDADRQKALECLQDLHIRGYLTLDEYEERTSHAINGVTRGDIQILFRDIPKHAFTSLPASTEVATVETPSKFPVRVNASAPSKKIGIFLLGTLGVVALVSVTNIGALNLLIPMLWIALYILKIGPASWYTDSRPYPQQLPPPGSQALPGYDPRR